MFGPWIESSDQEMIIGERAEESQIRSVWANRSLSLSANGRLSRYI
jgi:hypothetical protein